MKEATKDFAKFTVKTTYNDLPESVVRKAKNCILDTLGCTLAGFSSKAVQILLEFVKHCRGNSESTIFKFGYKFPSFWVAFTNACSGHDLELDDGHVLAHTHPGVTVILPAMAAGEIVKASGKDLITATVLGYELNIRLGEAITPPALYERRFHVPGLVGSFSAAIAAGKILSLDELEMANALGIACLGPVAPLETFQRGAMTKDAYAGWPSAVGIMAALLAQRGFTGADTILEGKSGFCYAVAGKYRVDRLTKNLGNEWNILTIYQKRHAMCSHGHTTMDAGLNILEKYHLKLENIKEIVVKTYEFNATNLNNREPKTDVAAKFSIPFCLAVVLTKGRPISPDDFTDSMLKDEEILELSRRIKVVLDPEVNSFHKKHEEFRRSIVEIITKDGKKYSSCVDVAKGWPSNPLTKDEVEAKFRILASTALDEKRIDAIIGTVDTLEEQENITKLIDLLVK